MAITAHFGADFTNFLSAVNAADTKLKGFEEDAAKVQKSVNRIGDSFSGKKIIQEANLAAKAVADIGGVTFLTQKEQLRLNATVQEAIAKYQALGAEAPEDLRRIANETSKLSSDAKGVATSVSDTGSSFQGLLTTLGPLGGAIAAAFSVQTVINFGKEILAAADTLTKLHDKTQVSIADLQRFQVAGDDAGNTIEEITGAVTAFQQRLGDPKPTTDFNDALKRIGVTAREFKALNPGQQFFAISEGLRAIEDPAERVNTALALGGRQLVNVLPTLVRGFDDVKDASVGMSDEATASLDTFGDKLQSTSREVKGTAGNIAGYLADLFGGGANSRYSIAGQVEAFFGGGALEKYEAAIKHIRDLSREPIITLPQIAPIPVPEGAERELDRQLSEQRQKRQEAAREADQLNRERNAAEARWIRISVENNNAWADAVTTIERNMLNERRTLEDAFYRNEEAKALATQRRQLDQFQKSVDDMNAEIQSALIPFAGEVGNDFSKELLDSLKQLRTSVPQLITDSFTGGGGLKGSLKAIGVQLANSFIQAFINELISARGSIKNALAGLFGGGAAKAAGAAGGGGVIAAIGSAIGIGGAPTQKAPENKVPVATNEPQPPAATVITTPTTPAPGQPGSPGGSVTQSILTGGFRSRTTTAAATPNVTNHNVVNLTIETPDAASFDRSWERQIVPRLHRELFTNALGTVTEINRIVAVKR